jgi:hypothetical protein
MSQERLAQLVHEHTAAIGHLERQMGTHEAIRRILRALVLEELTIAQALGILGETAERSPDPEHQAVCQQAMDALCQMQAEES